MITELLEREQELAALRGLLVEARAGQGGVALVKAPPGQGKTALLDALCADEEDIRVLRATGAALERDFPFGVVRQLAAPLLAEGRDVGAAQPVLDGTVRPELTLEPHYSALHVLHELAVELAAERPLLIVVDDAHFADPGSVKAHRAARPPPRRTSDRARDRALRRRGGRRLLAAGRAPAPALQRRRLARDRRRPRPPRRARVRRRGARHDRRQPAARARALPHARRRPLRRHRGRGALRAPRDPDHARRDGLGPALAPGAVVPGARPRGRRARRSLRPALRVRARRGGPRGRRARPRRAGRRPGSCTPTRCASRTR